MELFKVTCVTCRARLSVRDAALLGQIVACPRCGMMVHVTAPPTGATIPESAVATASAVPVIGQVTHSARDFEEAAAMAAASPATTNSPPIEPADASALPTFDDASHLAVEEPVAVKPLVEQASTSVAAPASLWARYKLAAVLVGAATAGALVVGLTLSLMDRGSSTVAALSPAQKVATAPGPAPLPAPAHDDAATSTAPPSTAPAAAPDALPPPGVGERAADDQPQTPKPAANDQAPAPPPADEPPNVPSDEPPADAAPASQPASPDVAAASAVNNTRAEPARPRLRVDPLDLDPEGLDLSSLFAGPQRDPLAASQLPAEPAPSSASVSPAPPAEQPPVASTEPVRRDESSGAGAPPPAEPLLARKLPAVKFQKMPLCQVLDLATQLSALPVSVAPDELRRTGVSAIAPVSAEVRDATIEGVLTAALKPLRLEPATVENQIVLRRSGDDKRRTVEYPVDDLAASPADTERLGQWIRELVAPQSWTPQGSGTLTAQEKSIRIEHMESTQYEVLLLLERYRLARGLPPRSKYPTGLLSPIGAYASLSERLRGPAVFTFSQYTSLGEIVRYWQEELGVAVLVDWPALAGERVWPQTRIACNAGDKSWAEALDAVLAPLGLAWRAVDRTAIQITARSKVASEPQVEVYRLAAGSAEQDAALVESIKNLAPELAGAPAPAVACDSAARVLAVRQSAASHRRMVDSMADRFDFAAVKPAR